MKYQDTNVIQKEIVDLMANENQNVMVVGDDAQSIYSFRGADYENILRFSETYPDCKIIKLKKNYRSLQKLIDFTNSVNNSFKIGYKKLLMAVRKALGKKPVVKKFMKREDEAKYIVDEIFEHHEAGNPIRKNGCVVPVIMVLAAHREGTLSAKDSIRNSWRNSIRREIPYPGYVGLPDCTSQSAGCCSLASYSETHTQSG